MTKYHIDYDPEFADDINKFKKAGQKQILEKINILLEELVEHPRTGTGHPERLKGYPDVDRWSRRITQKHRLIYDIYEDIVVVLVLTAYGHYDDN